MQHTLLGKMAILGLLVGCSIQGTTTTAQDPGTAPKYPAGKGGWDGKFVPLSAEATKEISRQFGGNPPRALAALDNTGKIVVFQPAGVTLKRIENYPIFVGNLLEPPLPMTILGTQKNPPTYWWCVPMAGGGQYCF